MIFNTCRCSNGQSTIAQPKIESFLNPKRPRLEAKNEDDPDDENSGDNDILPSKGQAGLVKKDHIFQT